MHMKGKTIMVETVVSKSVNDVWEYFTKPVHITQWNFASDDWECPRASNDVRVGGKLISRMQSKDGKYGFDFEGTYTEIEDKKKLIYNIADGRQVQVNFQKISDKLTKVIEVFEMEQINNEELQRAGWQSILNNFKKYCEIIK